MSNLSTLSAAALVALYNGAVLDYAPEGFAEVRKFASKAKGAEAIEALCAAGNLAVEFDGETATIVDAMTDADADADDDAAPVPHGDGKGKLRPWGVALASKEWLAAHPRGDVLREEYRTWRRGGARSNRKANKAAREAKADAAMNE